MLPLRYRTRWQIATGLLLTAVFLMAIVPALWAPAVPVTWSATDKWLHGLTFMLLALWYTGQYAPESYWRIAVGLTAYGGLIEVGQSMIPYRTAEWGDLVADVAGIAVGLAIAVRVTGGWSVRAEHWLGKKFGRSIPTDR